MKTGILSFYLDNYKSLAAITNSVRKEYCERHGYQFVEKIGPYANPDWYYAFDRLKYLYDILFNDVDGVNLDVVHVQNLHAGIMNLTIKIESYLEDGYDFYITRDCHGINAGSFIVRKSKWLKDWLEFLLSMENIHKNHCWYEQKLMMDNIERPEWIEKTKILPQWTINGYFYGLYNINYPDGEFRDGESFILHTPGTSLEHRIEIFSGEKVKQLIKR